MSVFPQLIKDVSECTTVNQVLQERIAEACKVKFDYDEDGRFGPYRILPQRVRFLESVDAAMNAIPHGWSIKSSDIWELGTHGSKTMRRVTLVNNRTGQFVHGDFWQAQVMKPKDYYRDVERTALAFAITLAAFNARIEDEKET